MPGPAHRLLPIGVLRKAKYMKEKEVKMVRELQGQTLPGSPLSSANLFLLSQANFLQIYSSRSQKGSEAMRETITIINYNLYTLPLA